MITDWVSITREMSMQDKLIAEMLNAEIETQFASKAAEIVRKRQPKGTGMDEWDPNELCHIREFNKDIEIGNQVYCTLRGIYRLTFSNLDEVEIAIKETADGVSNNMLVKFGWRKEEAKC